MASMIRISIIIGVLVSLLLLAGCGDQRILERLGFIHSAGFDLLPKKEGQTEQMVQATITLPIVNAQDGKLKFESLSAVGKTSKEAKYKMSQQTDLQLVSGQLRNLLYGTSLAKKGLWQYLDTFMRDPAISQRVKITIVSGSAGKIISKTYKSHPPTGQYIDRLLDKEAKFHAIPKVSLYEFTRDYFDDGIDPVAPIIKDAGKNVALDGIALFDNDRYVTKLPAADGVLFGFMSGSFKEGNINIDLGEIGNEGEYVFTTLNNKRRISIKRGTGAHPFVADIRITIQGAVLEYNGELMLSDDQDKKKLEQLVSSYYVKNFEEMMKNMQKNKVDSIGIGKYVRNSLSYREWTQLDWNEVYPTVDVNFDVTVEIKNYGKFEK